MNHPALVAVTTIILILAGCDQKPAAPPAGSDSTAAADPRAGASEKSAGESRPASGHGHSGEVVDLGTSTVGELTVQASRDAGELKAGGDAAIDVRITTADGKPASVTAVRFWIGTEDAKGSVKARAEIEDPQDPGRWHTHAELPNPLPEGARLWVEIETAEGKKAAGFDLKR